MPDENRRKIIERANRMLRQSKTLRKMSDELLQESQDLREIANRVKDKKDKKKKRAAR